MRTPSAVCGGFLVAASATPSGCRHQETATNRRAEADGRWATKTEYLPRFGRHQEHRNFFCQDRLWTKREQSEHLPRQARWDSHLMKNCVECFDPGHLGQVGHRSTRRLRFRYAHTNVAPKWRRCCTTHVCWPPADRTSWPYLARGMNMGYKQLAAAFTQCHCEREGRSREEQ